MKLLRDTWLIFQRSLRATLGNPVWVVVGLTQPILYLVLFGPLLVPLVQTPGFDQTNAWNFFVPGLLIQLALFGGTFVGFGLIAELRYGIIERMRVTPVSRMGLMLGRALRDMLILLVQAALLVAVAMLFGLQVTVVGLVGTFLLICLLGLLLASVSYSLALRLKNDDAFASIVTTITLPLLLLSGVFLPLTLAPGWLQAIASVNPLLYAVDGSRAMLNEQFASSSILIAFGLFGVLVIVGLWLARRSFSRAIA